MDIFRDISACFRVSAFVCTLCACSPLAAFTVAEYGKLAADIVLPSQPLAAERYAADELKYHLDKAFGSSAAILTEDALARSKYHNHIFVGATAAAKRAGLPGRPFVADEHIVKTAGNALFLLGYDSDVSYEGVTRDLWRPTLYATVYAVYDFLENEMGVKWIWPGPTGEVIPRRRSLRFSSVNRRSREPLADRIMGSMTWNALWVLGFSTYESARAFFDAQAKFLVRHRLGRRRHFRSGHGFTDWWDRFGASHPEYFNLLPGGVRRPAAAGRMVTLCVSEPGVWRQTVADWKKWMDTKGTRQGFEPWVNCCENDYVALCQCHRCRAWDAPDPRFMESPYWNGTVTLDDIESMHRRGNYVFNSLLTDHRWGIMKVDTSLRPVASLSDRYAKFYNAVQAEVRKVNPAARVIGYAYENYLEAPKETRVDPSVVIEIVPRSYFPYDQAESEHFRAAITGWRKAGVKDFIYRPNFMLAGGNYPFDHGRLIVEDFAFAYKNGMKGCSFDSLRGAWACHTMMYYTLIRAFREPLRDYDVSRDELLSAFGPAKKEITRYFDFIRAHTASWTPDEVRRIAWQNPTGNHNGGGSFNTGAAILGDYFDDAFFVKGNKLLDAARAAARGDSMVERRVEFLRKGLGDARLTRLTRIAQKAMDAAPRDKRKADAFKKAFDELVAYRATVEGDFVCNFMYESSKERKGLRWPFTWWKHEPGKTSR
ncbi:MAG: DUF4838 domain-containing protein [Lentisphaerae bacterium]|nr:DUF4838 domain-containing protein [Lentisphaerota bacterium]